MITEQTIAKVKERADIVEVISSYITLHKKGSRMIGICPFHNDHHPSLNVHPVKQRFHCFACGATGDVIEFIKLYHQTDFQEAVNILAQRYGIAMEYDNRQNADQAKVDEKESIKAINEYMAKTYISRLNGKPLKYLLNRGLTLRTINEWNLGYAPSVEIYPYLIHKGFKDEFIYQSGLVAGRQKNFFSERIIFPWKDISGNIIGFNGRALEDIKPKYINIHENPLFHKRATLYGIDKAWKSIRSKDRCIIVEGQMDVIKLHQKGATNVVCASGTALTEEQVRLIRRITHKVLLVFDGDNAGREATLKAISVMVPLGMEIEIFELPEGVDPDEYAERYGVEDFNLSAKGIIEYLMNLFS